MKIRRMLRSVCLLILFILAANNSVLTQEEKNCILYDTDGQCSRRCTSYNSDGSCATVEVILRRSRSGSNSSDSVTTRSSRPLPENSQPPKPTTTYEVAPPPPPKVLVQQEGESMEDFQKRVAAARRAAGQDDPDAANDQAQSKVRNYDPDDVTTLYGQTLIYDRWARFDVQRYPDSDTVTWLEDSFEVTNGGGNTNSITGFTAWITDKTGFQNPQGGYLRISNPNPRFPLYFGIGTGLRDKVEPGKEKIVPLPPRYVPTNPAQLLELSPRVETLNVRWVQ